MRAFILFLMLAAVVYALVATKPHVTSIVGECARQSGYGSGHDSNASEYLYRACIREMKGK